MKAGLIDPFAGGLIAEDGRCGYWNCFLPAYGRVDALS